MSAPLIAPTPPVCSLCRHTIRTGESYVPRASAAESGAPVSSVIHMPFCPTDREPSTLVPCGPCLQQLLTADPAELHVCDGGTSLLIEDGNMIFVRETRCPCCCQASVRESAALRAARAQARRAEDS